LLFLIGQNKTAIFTPIEIEINNAAHF
jgi:hypothetical protein